MTDITPPPELVQKWEEDWYRSKVKHVELLPYIAAQAAQYRADQPTDKELLDLMPETMRDEFAAASDVYSTATGGQVAPGLFRTVLNTVALEYARAVLAHWGNR